MCFSFGGLVAQGHGRLKDNPGQTYCNGPHDQARLGHARTRPFLAMARIREYVTMNGPGFVLEGISCSRCGRKERGLGRQVQQCRRQRSSF